MSPMINIPSAQDLVRRALASPPSWARQPLQDWHDTLPFEKQAFVTEEHWKGMDALEVFRVVGVCHPGYVGKTWLDLLTGGQRMRQNLARLDENPDYYQPGGLRESNSGIDFLTLDGLRFYVGNNGLHRTCIARFLGDLPAGVPRLLSPVEITHYQVDYAFYGLYRRALDFIQENHLAIRLEPIRQPVGRDDGEGWKTDHFHTAIVWYDLSDRRPAKVVELDYHHFIDRLVRLESHTLKAKLLKPLGWVGRWMRRQRGRP
ncbi:hypothetical protein [Azotobacter vinelandii]|uniref:hypothetical protein n=1 Tax=Azotobacter vinelandii TaxID=354 RepID=UPI00077436B5|nr:hypothetical protein [Azotobacter vinelandii]